MISVTGRETACAAPCLLLLLLLPTLPCFAADEIRDENPEASTLEHCRAALAQQPVMRHAHHIPTPLRVLSWNTRKYSHEDAAGYLLTLSSKLDILLLQESIDEYPASTPRLSQRAFSPGYKSRESLSGVETRSRAAFDVRCRLRFLEPWLRTPKAVSVTRIPFRRQSLLIVNLHAINFTLGSRAYRQQLDALGQLLSVHQGPVLFGGDLNNWNPWRQKALEQFAQEHALRTVHFSPDWRSRHLGSPVDSLLLRGLRALDATAIPTHLSDHNPVYASLLHRVATTWQTVEQAQTSSTDPVTISACEQKLEGECDVYE